MKKLILLLGIFGILLVPQTTLAATDCEGTTQSPDCGVQVFDPVCDEFKRPGNTKEVPAVCKEANSVSPIFGPNGLIDRIVTILSFAVGIISLFVLIIFGGLRMVTAGGDSNTVASARQTMIFASVGIMVAVLARVLVEFIIAKLVN